ncbi:MAG: DUF4159 domain-containing protein [Candidatus Omnitrophica bacterium]|nr:DUF4159 domain-containing protein [Candidatus Omnitrophota bacterium]
MNTTVILLLVLSQIPAGGKSPLLVTREPLYIARVQYYGGDYYTDPTALPNLAAFASEKTGTTWKPLDGSATLLDPKLSSYPVLYLTGHGDIQFKNAEILALRQYLEEGGPCWSTIMGRRAAETPSMQPFGVKSPGFFQTIH